MVASEYDNFSLSIWLGRQVMSAPNLLRVGATESIFVECQDCVDSTFNVRIEVWNHPTKKIRLANTTVLLNSGNGLQGLGEILVNDILLHCLSYAGLYR